MFGFFKQRRREQVRHAPFPAGWDEIIARNCPCYRPPERGRPGRAPRRHPGLPRREDVRGLRRARDDRRDPGHDRRAGVPALAPSPDRRLSQARHDPGLPERVRRQGDRAARAAGLPRGRAGAARRGLARGRRGPRPGTTSASGAADVRDGHNVVLHEFAHQLDFEDGVADGAPVLARRSNYVAWARVLGEEYDRLRRDRAGRRASSTSTARPTPPSSSPSPPSASSRSRPR